MLLEIKQQKHKPIWPVLVIAKKHGHKHFFYKYENILNKTRKRETVPYKKTIGESFSVNIRISQPSKVKFTSVSPRRISLFSG